MAAGADGQRAGLQLQGPWGRPVLLLPGAYLRMGRHASNDVVVEHASVSRFHAVIDWTRAEPALVDLGSANGTHVDGVAAAPDVAVTLGAGSTLRLADVRLLVRDATSGAARQDLPA